MSAYPDQQHVREDMVVYVTFKASSIASSGIVLCFPDSVVDEEGIEERRVINVEFIWINTDDRT